MDKEKRKIPNILFVSRDNAGCGYYRCEQPAKFIQRMGLAETQVVLTKPNPEQLHWADLVVMQEMGSVNASNIAKYCVDNKIPYISEIDDFIQHISPHNISGYGSWNPGTLYVHRAMRQISSGMALTVSTNQLAREYHPYHPLIYVVPNYLNKELWDNPQIKKSDGKIRIGWAGGNAHGDDLKMVSKVMDKIVKEYKGKVIFETMGMTKQELSGVFPMKPFNDICPSCGYEGEVKSYYGESIENYPLMLAAKGWDIAIAPVINNSFGNAKSDIKIKEYAIIGASIVASNVIPYREAVDNGAKILLAETFDEWYNNIKGLIKSQKKRDEIVRNNKDWVSQYWIQDNAQKIFDIYQQTISQAELVFADKITK